jgi:hypothetical protein
MNGVLYKPANHHAIERARRRREWKCWHFRCHRFEPSWETILSRAPWLDHESRERTSRGPSEDPEKERKRRCSACYNGVVLQQVHERVGQTLLTEDDVHRPCRSDFFKHFEFA